MKNTLLLVLGLLIGIGSTYMWMSRKKPLPADNTITGNDLMKTSNNFVDWLFLAKNDSLGVGKTKMDTVYRGCMITKQTLQKLVGFDGCYVVFGMDQNTNKIKLFAEPLMMTSTSNVSTSATNESSSTTTTSNTAYTGTGTYIGISAPYSFCPYICPTVLSSAPVVYAPTLSGN